MVIINLIKLSGFPVGADLCVGPGTVEVNINAVSQKLQIENKCVHILHSSNSGEK